MIAEISAIVAGVNMASNAIKQVAEKKDGKTMVLGALNSNVFDLDTALPTQQDQQQQTASLKCADVPKAGTAKLEAFVVSFCPFGLQAQRLLAPVANLMPDNVTVRYLGSIENGKITKQLRSGWKSFANTYP